MRREEKLRETMLRYLEGSLPAEEVEKLNQAVEYDWAARREMAELMLQETLLCRVGQEAEFFELDVRKVKPERKTTARYNTTTRIMKSVELPLARVSSRPKISGIVAIAAATLFAVSVGVAAKRLQPDVPAPVGPVITVLPEPAPEAVKPAPPPVAPPTMKAQAPPAPPAPAVRPPLRSPTVRKPVVPAPAPKTAPAPLNPAVQDGIMIQPAPEIPPPLPPKTPPKK